MALRDRRVTVYRSPRLKIDFEMHRAAIAKIAMGRDLRDACHRVAEFEAKPYAISISPRSKASHQHYADSFQVFDVIVSGFPRRYPMRRVGSDLVNTVEHALMVEVGTPTTKAHWVLRRTLDHLSRHGRRGN